MRKDYIKISKTKNLNVYKDKNYKMLFNDYNKSTLNKLDFIENSIKLPYFEVPTYTRKTIWGKEIIFIPFTDKLFKIVDTYIDDTSIQLHPLKNEKWFPLKETIIYDGKKLITVNSSDIVSIDSKSIHCMKKDGMVFEIQDNIIFDGKETIRIFDVNNREIADDITILKNTMPQIRNNVKIIKNKIINKINNQNDLFIFCIDGEINLKVNKKNIRLNTHKLYYINQKYVKFIEINGICAMCTAKYFEV